MHRSRRSFLAAWCPRLVPNGESAPLGPSGDLWCENITTGLLVHGLEAGFRPPRGNVGAPFLSKQHLSSFPCSRPSIVEPRLTLSLRDAIKPTCMDDLSA